MKEYYQEDVNNLTTKLVEGLEKDLPELFNDSNTDKIWDSIHEKLEVFFNYPDYKNCM